MFIRQWVRQSNVFFPLSVAVIALVWTWVFAFSFPLPLEEGESVIVHYSVYFGIQQLGAPQALFWFPGIGTFIFFLHVVFAYVFSARDDFWSHALLLMAALVNILVFFVVFFLFLIH